jgi:cytidylate kinase
MEKLEYTHSEPWRNVFEKYFREIMDDNHRIKPDPGPFVSISREFGCMAEDLAARLAKELTAIGSGSGDSKPWRWLNKEIVDESAKALGMKPSQLKYVFMSEKKSVMDEIVGAFSTRYFKSDKKIRNTIVEVVKSIAREGHVIIVGRGAVAFGRDIPRSLHVRLIAPLEWRMEHICKNYDKTPDEALDHIHQVDRERKFLIDSFFGKTTDNSIFHAVFNRQLLSEDEILQGILHLMSMKKLL